MARPPDSVADGRHEPLHALGDVVFLEEHEVADAARHDVDDPGRIDELLTRDG